VANDNWNYLGANTYYVRRYIEDSYYDVYITNVGLTPIISSKGYTPWYYNGGQGPKLSYAAIGSVSLQSGPEMTERGVKVDTRVDPIFNVAMAAIDNIDFAGNDVETDSFDSSDPLYRDLTLPGGYPANNVSMQKANGDVVTDGTTFNIGNAQIKGQAKTGPKGSLAMGPNSSVGSKSWVEGGNAGIQPGYFADDMNVLFPPVSVSLVTPMMLTTTNAVIDGVGYSHVISSPGDYFISNLEKSLYVGASARLLVNVKIAIAGTERIYIAPGGRLKLYCSGATASIGGNGVINATGNADNFYYFGLPSNVQLSLGGNSAFVGAIYAPSAHFTLGGGGNNVYDFIGASVTRSVKMNGKYRFHYDEALKNNGMGRGYIPTNWKEM
jgi:hypothetical protein